MRDPRPEELRLMESLRDGPKPVRTGPVGRCVKRGWCSVALGTPRGEAIVLYSLTDKGRALLEAQSPDETCVAEFRSHFAVESGSLCMERIG